MESGHRKAAPAKLRGLAFSSSTHFGEQGDREWPPERELSQPRCGSRGVETGTSLDPLDLDRRLARALGSACGVRELASDTDRVGVFGRLSRESEAVREACLRRAFENTWKLGRSARRLFGPIPDPNAWADLLARLSTLVCVAAPWSPGPEGSWETVRSPCPSFERYGRFACDLFREAADGLVCGLGARVRFAKLTSPFRGGTGCWSRIFPREKPELGWREARSSEREQLEQVVEALSQRGLVLEVLGMVEDAVIYRMAPSPGSGARVPPLAEALVQNVFSHLAPGLRAVSAQPRPVLAHF
jgi:hypothetical protein